jgi:hypothetical protein
VSTGDDLTKALIRHARKNGPECVMTSAVELGLSQANLVKLQKAIDDLPARKVGRVTIPKTRHRLTAETRVKRLLGIDDQEGE